PELGSTRRRFMRGAHPRGAQTRSRGVTAPSPARSLRSAAVGSHPPARLPPISLRAMALDPKLLEILACPDDKGPLLYFPDEQTLYNPRLKRRYSVLDGDIPDLLIDDSETVDDAEDKRLLAKASADGIKPTFEQ